ncbi:pyridoxal phosphate-dependent aminotransferase [Tabrizicola sp.]|uniref:pyridoxal phosphate-dependent aminotransferase n=1 Tax=Tabrizicola sp. TaxID=2005166 RepID=UPI0027364200|nr:pyridoxal phosphate-dependent aminotransferase [Tabrizicola sp.]MDP3195502.1 pyridoxal phosphate-dependent aminotransferase [Tabrizicola sp.]
MKVTIHKLFEYFIETAAAEPPECFIGFSFARPPRLKDFLADLDPELSLDWNGASFLGLPALRNRVLDQAGLSDLSPDDVLITAGTAEANYLLFRQLLASGDEIITETPGWPQAGNIAKSIGARLVEVPRDESQGWHLDPQAVARAITPRTRMIFLTNPNNPTGRLIPESDLRALADLAERHGIWLVVDEVYAGLEWVGHRMPSVAGMTRFGITTGSVSKALGLQGLRTGWMICQSPQVICDAMILRENGSEIMNILGEHIAEVALRPDRLAGSLAQARKDGAATLDRLEAFVDGQARLGWHRPEAGLIGLARVEGTDGESLARALLQPPYRTFLLPGSAYGLPQHVRIGAGGGPEARLEEGLGRLSALLCSGQI